VAIAVAGLSLAVNGFQASYIYRTVYRINDDRQSTRLSRTVGKVFPPLDVLDLNGAKRQISYETPTVLYVFSPSCHWCVQNSNEIQSLARRLNGRFKVLGISISQANLKSFVAEHNMEFPVYSAVSGTNRAYEFDSTPETLVFSKEGKLEAHFNGAYLGPTKSALYSFFHIGAL
jgi:thioredoxin-related protein